MAEEGEPRRQYAPDRPLYERCADKAAELGVTRRTIQRWVQGFQRRGEAGLVGGDQLSHRQGLKVDDRWVETALEVMAEHTGESKPSRTPVIERTQARVIARFGPGAVAQPSRTTAFRVLEDLERRHPLFRPSTKRNRDITDRPKQAYGKLRPTRPGEYLLMDTTRLDVFAFDAARIDPGILQDLPYRRRGDSCSQPGQFPVDSAVAPFGVLAGQPEDQGPDHPGRRTHPRRRPPGDRLHLSGIGEEQRAGGSPCPAPRPIRPGCRPTRDSGPHSPPASTGCRVPHSPSRRLVPPSRSPRPAGAGALAARPRQAPPRKLTRPTGLNSRCPDRASR